MNSKEINALFRNNKLRCNRAGNMLVTKFIATERNSRATTRNMTTIKHASRETDTNISGIVCRQNNWDS